MQKKLTITLTLIFITLAQLFAAEASNANILIGSTGLGLRTEIEEKGMSFNIFGYWSDRDFGTTFKWNVDISDDPSVTSYSNELQFIGTGDCANDEVVNFYIRTEPFYRISSSVSTSIIPEPDVYYTDSTYSISEVTTDEENTSKYQMIIPSGSYPNEVVLMKFKMKWQGSEEFSAGSYGSTVRFTYERD